MMGLRIGKRWLDIKSNIVLSLTYSEKLLPLGGEEVIFSQSRVWRFPFALITTFGERNRNPGRHFPRGLAWQWSADDKRELMDSSLKIIA